MPPAPSREASAHRRHFPAPGGATAGGAAAGGRTAGAAGFGLSVGMAHPLGGDLRVIVEGGIDLQVAAQQAQLCAIGVRVGELRSKLECAIEVLHGLVEIALELEPFQLSLVNNVDSMVRFIDEVDQPAVRAIVSDAKAHEFKMSSIILGLVKSKPFQMRSSR